MKSSKYINDERRDYSLYVLHSRAIPSICDGLKPSGRRVLWTARDGHKYKSATLAGATMPIHPHATPEGAINTLAAPYGNNIPLFDGIGAFGTLLDPTAYGASRYTSVKVSDFTKDVVFRDIEIVPMVENYDSTLMEPNHFLPLIPTVLLNPSEGIAVGFACNILPRSLEDIITAQIMHLQGTKRLEEKSPTFLPTKSVAVEQSTDGGDTKWTFCGDIEVTNSTSIRVTKLPYGLLHGSFINRLIKLEEAGSVVDYDDYSRDNIDIRVKVKREFIADLSKREILKKLGLIASHSENMNVINFDGSSVLSTNFCDLIRLFTDWRLTWYKNRYERLISIVNEDIQKLLDILTAIKMNVGGVARKTKSREELVSFLEEIKIVNTDYIANLPVYRFTEEEKSKAESRLKELKDEAAHYNELIGSEKKRRDIYVKELKDVLKKYG